MKKILITIGLLVNTALCTSSYAQVNVNVNIGSQPIWGPTGYDYVDYYYLPDLDIYYYVPQRQWIYFDGGRWITAATLPPRYNQYNLYQLHKVVINENQPYLHNAVYKARYASFKGRHDQQPIRDSRDARYFVINNHPMHSQMANGRSLSKPGAPSGRMAAPQRELGGRGREGHDRTPERNDRSAPNRNGRP